MNTAGLPFEPPTGKAFGAELNTWPVGFAPGTGTVRASDTGPPLTPPVYTVAFPELLSATQMGVVGPAASPQAFFRFGSTSLAPNEALLAIRLVCLKLFAGAAVAMAGAAAATSPPAATITMTAERHLLPRGGLSVPFRYPGMDRRACGMKFPFVVGGAGGSGAAGYAGRSLLLRTARAPGSNATGRKRAI